MHSHSYTFIEGSVRNGVLEDLQHHQAGPPEGTVRSVGSIIQPAKGTRNRFTQEDDRILWNWVHINPQKRGGTDGNEIYKQLEAKVRKGHGLLHAELWITPHSIHSIRGKRGETTGSSS